MFNREAFGKIPFRSNYVVDEFLRSNDEYAKRKIKFYHDLKSNVKHSINNNNNMYSSIIVFTI